ncbi:MAG: hypothetical protein Q8N39_05870 [Pelolinea sp.]|nr:hypothetical protein [Pelolinea sp.]
MLPHKAAVQNGLAAAMGNVIETIKAEILSVIVGLQVQVFEVPDGQQKVILPA